MSLTPECPPPEAPAAEPVEESPPPPSPTGGASPTTPPDPQRGNAQEATYVAQSHRELALRRVLEEGTCVRASNVDVHAHVLEEGTCAYASHVS